MLERITPFQRSKIVATGLATISLVSAGMHQLAEDSERKRIKDQAAAAECIATLGISSFVEEKTASEACKDFIVDAQAADTVLGSPENQLIHSADVRYFADRVLDQEATNPDTAAQTGVAISSFAWLFVQSIFIVPSYHRKNRENRNI